MSDVTYTYNFAQGETTIDQLRAVATQIQGDLSQLESSVANLLANWTTQAQADYQIAQQTWNAAAGNMQNALQIASQTLNSVNDGYQGVENRSVSRWSK